MLKVRLFLTMFSLFCLLCGNAIADDKMRVLLDWFVNPDHGPLIIAQENGYFGKVSSVHLCIALVGLTRTPLSGD